MQDRYTKCRFLLLAITTLVWNDEGASAWQTAFVPCLRRTGGVRPPSSFAVSRRKGFCPYESFTGTTTSSVSRRTPLSMGAAPSSIEFETDPFKILQMEPTADKKQIKRAYKRMALKYHPDMVTNKDSTSQERKTAGDRFAKINWAYETLSGKGSGGASSSTSSYSRSTSSSSSAWEPPHRRKSSYSGGTNTAGGRSSSPSTDWRDYIPNGGYNDDSQYDAGGDSFGQIFADLLVGAAGAAASGGASGIFRDFVEFLENNVDGMGSGVGGGDDADLTMLLRTGSVEAIGDEMDDTQLLVDQLETKSRKLEDEVWTLQAELNQVTRFSEQITLKEEIEELKARQEVVKGYQRKARKRLVALQTRYKELIVSSRSVDREETFQPRNINEPNAYDAPRRSSSTSSSSQRGTTTSSSSSTGATPDASKEKTWEGEGFGSFSRRGSARGRSRRPRSSSGKRVTEYPASSSSTSYDDTSSSIPRNNVDNSASNSSSRRNSDNTSFSTDPSTPYRKPTVPSTQAQDVNVPPHRRTSSVADDKRRLRDLKVDEEFDKLKREMGL